MKLTEQQLRNIIAEAVNNILNESYYDQRSDNPGGVKDGRVRKAGRNATTKIRGLDTAKGIGWIKNDNDWEVMKKHTGGKNAPRKLSTIFDRSVYGDKESMDLFFQAMRHMTRARYAIQNILTQYNVDAHAEKYGREWADKTRGDYI